MKSSRIETLDDRLIKASKKIKVLSTLAWPVGIAEKFLQDWDKGNASLPEISIVAPDVDAGVRELDSIASTCDEADPVGKFLAETARSYAMSGRMLMSVGTTAFTEYSQKVYGQPDFVYRHQDLSAVDGAKFFLEVTDRLIGGQQIPDTEADIPAEKFADRLRQEVDRFFEHDSVNVIVDDTISAKALAGATRIRLRGGALFSELDKGQLLNHEAFVHTATQLNGRRQVHLKSLGLGAPRTTRTQEGIAVLAGCFRRSTSPNGPQIYGDWPQAWPFRHLSEALTSTR